MSNPKKAAYGGYMTYKEFKKLTIAERKEITKVNTVITEELLETICKEEYKVLVNGTDCYDCYISECGAKVFRYGKHPKQAKMSYELDIHTLQVVGTTK